MLLISLVGEQPIPNLLPIRHLQPQENLLVYTQKTSPVARRLRRLVSGNDDLKVDLEVSPYHMEETLQKLQERIHGRSSLTFNLTSGTKIMMLAAYNLAVQTGSDFVYLQSEGRQSLLYRYTCRNGVHSTQPPDLLPTLITLDDYLRAHLTDYNLSGYSKDDQGRLTQGGMFEQAVHHALQGRLDEVIPGVRPEGVASQIELDLLVRCGNQVGLAELKLGGNKDSGKRGLDQLKMAGESSYLGTYAAQFLIVGSDRLSAPITTLARERGVQVIYLPGYTEGQPLPRKEAERLSHEIRRRLS